MAISRAVERFVGRSHTKQDVDAIKEDLARYQGDVLPGKTLDAVQQAVRESQTAPRVSGVELTKSGEGLRKDIGRGTIDVPKQDVAAKVGRQPAEGMEGKVSKFATTDKEGIVDAGKHFSQAAMRGGEEVTQNDVRPQGTPNNEWKGHVSPAVGGFADQPTSGKSLTVHKEPDIGR